MKLVLGTHRFDAPGGMETYLLTVAEQLGRLGHEVIVFAGELGAMADFATSRGLDVVGRENDLPDSADALLAQDGITSSLLARRYPSAPQIFVAHEAWDTWLLSVPPRFPGTVSAVVVMNERVERRMRALAGDFEVVRLRQPIDTRRFAPVEAAETPRRVLVLSNYVDERMRDRVEAVCREAGLELEHVGERGQPETAPENALRRADVVVAQGRAALEAMACARAVYLMDRQGTDGWITPANYELFEAQGFAGGASTGGVFSEQGFRSDLSDYEPEMGAANRELVHHRHYVGTHVHRLVERWRETGARESQADLPLSELARMVRIQWQTDRQLDLARSRNEWLEREVAENGRELPTVRLELEQLRDEREQRLRATEEVEGRLRQAEGRAREAEDRAKAAEVRTDEAEGRADEAEGRQRDAEERIAGAEGSLGKMARELQNVRSSASWRLTRPLRAARRALSRRR